MKNERMCKWFHLCPLRRFEQEGKLDKKWRRIYCLGDYLNCVRYQMEEAGRPHPDNMLPDGMVEGCLD